MVVIAVIGCGLMGVRIAGEFAIYGHEVHIYDTNEHSLQTVHTRLNDDLNELKADGLLLNTDLKGSIVCFNSLKEAVQNAELVIECIIENFDVKSTLLKDLCLYAPKNTIITTNTIKLDVNKLSDYVQNKQRFLGLRFLYPVYFINDVEITPTEMTSVSVIQNIRQLLSEMDMTLFFRKGSCALLLTEADIIRQRKRRKETLMFQISLDQAESCNVNNEVKANNDEKKLICAICLENQRDTVLRPCNHMVSCYQCSRTLYNKNQDCPVCRKKIDEVLRIFIS